MFHHRRGSQVLNHPRGVPRVHQESGTDRFFLPVAPRQFVSHLEHELGGLETLVTNNNAGANPINPEHASCLPGLVIARQVPVAAAEHQAVRFDQTLVHAVPEGHDTTFDRGPHQVLDVPPTRHPG